MIQPDTIKLLRECDAGIKMGTASIHDVMDYVKDEELKKLLDDHVSGKRDNWRQIWCVFMFLVWYDEYFVKR